MNELYLELGGIRIRVAADDPVSAEQLEDYIAAPGSADHSFQARIVRQLEPPAGALLYSEGSWRIYRDGGSTLRYVGEVNEDPCNAYVRTVLEGADGVLQYNQACLSRGITGRLLLNAIDLPHLLTIHDGFLLHASYIEHEGRAILFTAPSETGKSTQAKLWCDHAGAELVNGDRAAVRIIDGAIFACGTPFSGSSPVRRNVRLPLSAIVYLSQSPENTITRLRGVRAFRRVWEGCTVNTWDRSDVEKATKTVSEVVSRIPVYHLACTPDIRAVELLKNTMEVET